MKWHLYIIIFYFLIELFWIHSKVCVYSLPLKINNQSGSMANWLERQSSKREVHLVGSSPNVGKNFFV